jgi:hypothetical protein
LTGPIGSKKVIYAYAVAIEIDTGGTAGSSQQSICNRNFCRLRCPGFFKKCAASLLVVKNNRAGDVVSLRIGSGNVELNGDGLLQ